MRMLQSILLATDFRPVCDDALNALAQLAMTFGSRVSVLHVVEPTGAAAHLYGLQCGEKSYSSEIDSITRFSFFDTNLIGNL